MLIPKRVKRRKQHKGRMTGAAHKGNTIAYGEYGLVAEECGWIKSNQIEAARIAMTRFIKRGGKVWIDIFPHKPITGVSEADAREAMRLAGHKLPVKCKFVKKEAAPVAAEPAEGGEQ